METPVSLHRQSLLERFSKWIKLKIYQIEVTYSVYIFTPAEKFIFYTIAFLLISLTSIAVFLYLPRHIAFLVGRAWFYFNGEAFDTRSILNALNNAKIALTGDAASIADAAGTTAAAAAAAATTAGGIVREL